MNYLNKLVTNRLCNFFLAQDLNEQTSLYLSVLGGYVDVVEYLLSFRVHALTLQELETFKRRSTHQNSLSESKSIKTINHRSFLFIHRYHNKSI
jgi:hypothetical protein